MPNYRSLVPGGFYGNPDKPRNGLPASVWFNNPGAVNGAHKNGTPVQWVQSSPGFVKTVVIGGGNPIAVFETPEQGVALWYNLMVRYRALGKSTLQDIINYYGGGQDYSDYVRFVVNKTGFPASKVIALNDDKVLLPFFRAMIHYEAGKPTPLKDEQIAYGIALARGTASSPVKPTPALRKGDLAAMIVAAMEAQNIPVDKGDDLRNIVYVEGIDADGTPNKNRRNAFDDLRTVIVVGKDGPQILGAWDATIETGELYTMRPIASDGKGAFRIAFGHHKGAWIRGKHRGYDAWVQQGGPVSGYRDNNKDFSREGDQLDTGYFGINQHHAFNAPRDNIGGHSAGCLVGRTVAGHEEFMRLSTQDARYRANPHGFKQSITVLKAADVLAAKPKPAVTKTDAGAAGAVVIGAGGIAAWLDAHPSVILIAVCLAAVAVGAFLAWRSKS